MHISVRIIDGALKSAATLHLDGAGASISFEGIVRGMEDGRPLEALDYEAYEPMSLRELHSLASRIANKYGLFGIEAEHSKGRVRIGEVSFRLQVASKHRAEGLAAMTEFIDRLKQEVPLWKVPVFADAVSTTAREL